MSALDKIESKIYKDFLSSEVLEYYINKAGIELNLARGLHFSNALLRFTAHYNTKSKVRKLSLEVVKNGDLEPVETSRELRLLLVDLIQRRLDNKEPCIGLSTGNRPIAAKRLGEKASEFKRGGFNPHYVLHGNYQNANATRFTELEKGLLWGIYKTIGKQNAKTTHRYYSIMALTYSRIVYEGREYSIRDMSLSTCKNYLTSPNIEPIFTAFLSSIITKDERENKYLRASKDSKTLVLQR